MIFYPLIFFLLPDQIFNVVYPRLEFPVEAFLTFSKCEKFYTPGAKNPKTQKMRYTPGVNLALQGYNLPPRKGTL